MKSKATLVNKKTVLPPKNLLYLYNLFKEKDPLPYSYIEVSGIKGFNKRPHLKFFTDNLITYLTRDAMKHSGIYESQDPAQWNCSWGAPFQIDKYIECEPWQKVNHFCGSFLIGRKSELDYRMEELYPLAPELIDFYPLTFALPRNRSAFDSAVTTRRYWIFKLNFSSCGRDIVIYDSTTPISSLPIDFSEFKGVAQEYIEKPLTLFGRKFDIRLYVMVTSLRPLKIYLNTQGLVRFCPKPFSFENLNSTSHLTNFTINKNDPDFVSYSDSKIEFVSDCKWSLRFFLSFLSIQKKIDVSKIIEDFEKVVIATLITGGTAIRICHEPRTKYRKLSYELYGFDILLDEDFNSHLMEVNVCPSLSGQPSLMDYNIKYPLNLDLLRLANIIDFDLNEPIEKREKLKSDIENYEKKISDSISIERRRAVELNELDPWDSPVFADFEIVRDLIDELVRKASTPEKSASVSDYFDVNEELKISGCKMAKKDEDFKGKFSEKGHFRFIYPLPENVDKYRCCFKVMRYEDIVLQKWIQMTDEEKISIVQSYLLGYEEKY